VSKASQLSAMRSGLLVNGHMYEFRLQQLPCLRATVENWIMVSTLTTNLLRGHRRSCQRRSDFVIVE
jgi:hypothetical protein